MAATKTPPDLLEGLRLRLPRCSYSDGGVQCPSAAFYNVGHLDALGRPASLAPLCFIHSFVQADAFNARGLVAVLKSAVAYEESA